MYVNATAMIVKSTMSTKVTRAALVLQPRGAAPCVASCRGDVELAQNVRSREMLSGQRSFDESSHSLVFASS